MTDGGDKQKTILVVEDEPEVRQSTALVLEALDFSVVEAAGGIEMLAVLESDRDIDLLFVDLILAGGVNGAELAREAVASRPGLRVLLTSGRPELAKDKQFPVIGKPFRLSELGDKVKEALESDSGGGC